MFKVILYYHFTSIPDPSRFCVDHKRICKELELKGRVYVAAEGINGTLAGTPENIARYKSIHLSIPGFEKTEFKEDSCPFIPFNRLMVKVRNEIVALKPSMPVNLTQEKGTYLSPREWREALETDENFTLLDVRNDYETAIGHFEGALLPDVENFHELEGWLEGARLDKEKKVLMYCTGGIRCEKFSVLMMKKGFKNIFQLHGGIVQYAKEEGGAHFKGKCFVFDDRLSVPVNPEDSAVISRCAITGVPSDRYLNCAHMECNKLFICSEEGLKVYEGCCSEDCMKTGHHRPFDGKDVYAPWKRKHHYSITKGTP